MISKFFKKQDSENSRICTAKEIAAIISKGQIDKDRIPLSFAGKVHAILSSTTQEQETGDLAIRKVPR